MPGEFSQNLRTLRIISGGQTGVDRGALDAAIELGLPHGGWCPRGRMAEDGRIPDRYQLAECDEARYAARTELNVIDSDATLILCRRLPLRGGTRQTRDFAIFHNKSHRVVVLDEHPSLDDIRQWLDEAAIETLNVAGPRQSQSPGIQAQAREFIVRLLGEP